MTDAVIAQLPICVMGGMLVSSGYALFVGSNESVHNPVGAGVFGIMTCKALGFWGVFWGICAGILGHLLYCILIWCLNRKHVKLS